MKLWVPGDPVPPEWIEASRDSGWLAVAFNDHLERLIEAHIMAPRYGWPVSPLPRHRCLMASSLSLALPGKLESVALALSLPHQKDMAGSHNMLDMSKPRKPRKDEDPTGVYWHDDPARFERLYEYNKQDDEVERALCKRIGFLSSEEQAVWELDAKINDRGVYIDRDLITGAIKIDDAAHQSISNELSEITTGEITSTDQTEKLCAWLAAHGCPIDNIQKGTIARALTRKDIPEDARRVLELRRDGAHAATGKYAAMLNWRGSDGRARGCFRYHGASTGRWSSRGIQLQNLKRIPPGGVAPEAIDAVKTGDFEHLRGLFPDNPLSVVGEIARGALCAAPGHKFIDADFSGIESRVLAWLAGEQSKLDQWAKFDETGDPKDEPYYTQGCRFGIPEELARGTGKTCDLAFGFAGGAGAYRKQPGGDRATDADVENYKNAWRRAHPMTVKFWTDIEAAAIDAVQKSGKVFKAGAYLSWRCEGDYLRMRLPSGRELAYPFPSLFTNDRGYLALVQRTTTRASGSMSPTSASRGHGRAS